MGDSARDISGLPVLHRGVTTSSLSSESTDLESSDDYSDLCAGLLYKFPDTLALTFCLGSKWILILGFKRSYDWRPE